MVMQKEQTARIKWINTSYYNQENKYCNTMETIPRKITP